MAAILFIFLTFCSLVFGQNQTKSKDWPCPLAEKIAPCICYYESGNISMSCNNVVDINEIERVFSTEFPFNNLRSIDLRVQDLDVWKQSEAVVLPPNVFKDKTAKDIWIDLKLKEVHPGAFNNTAHLIESLRICGPDFNGRAINPIEDFPLHILLTFPNLKILWFHDTNLGDRVFANSKPSFHEMEFENLGKNFQYMPYML